MRSSPATLQPRASVEVNIFNTKVSLLNVQEVLFNAIASWHIIYEWTSLLGQRYFASINVADPHLFWPPDPQKKKKILSICKIIIIEFFSLVIHTLAKNTL